MVLLTQTVHLSWTNTNTVSKWTKTRFHKTHITLVFHRVHPKWFASLWYVQRTPCIYLSPRLALSPNRSKRASTWASSPWSTIKCVQNNFWPYSMFGTNRAPICSDRNTISETDQNEIPHESCHLGVPSALSKMISKPMVGSAQTVHLSSVKTSTISKQTKISFHMTYIT
jgi:hypothetical protein